MTRQKMIKIAKNETNICSEDKTCLYYRIFFLFSLRNIHVLRTRIHVKRKQTWVRVTRSSYPQIHMTLNLEDVTCKVCSGVSVSVWYWQFTEMFISPLSLQSHIFLTNVSTRTPQWKRTHLRLPLSTCTALKPPLTRG